MSKWVFSPFIKHMLEENISFLTKAIFNALALYWGSQLCRRPKTACKPLISTAMGKDLEEHFPYSTECLKFLVRLSIAWPSQDSHSLPKSNRTNLLSALAIIVDNPMAMLCPGNCRSMSLFGCAQSAQSDGGAICLALFSDWALVCCRHVFHPPFVEVFTA